MAKDDDMARLFWRNIAMDYQALMLMTDELIEVAPDALARSKLRYRLTFNCGHCPEQHSVSGSFTQALMGAQVLITRGINKITVEEEATALIEDQERAEQFGSKHADAADDMLSAIFTRKQ